MKSPTVITVANTEKDQYGNLNVTDIMGGVTRIGQKRNNLFPLFIQGRAVKLIWDNYKGKDYVSDAELFDGKPPVEKRIEPIEVKQGTPFTSGKPTPVVSKAESGSKPLSKDEQIEKAVWVKELGECIRAKIIDKTTPLGNALNSAYYTEMCRVLGINIKEVSKSRLVEEALKLGAKEIEKGD